MEITLPFSVLVGRSARLGRWAAICGLCADSTKTTLGSGFGLLGERGWIRTSDPRLKRALHIKCGRWVAPTLKPKTQVSLLSTV